MVIKWLRRFVRREIADVRRAEIAEARARRALTERLGAKVDVVETSLRRDDLAMQCLKLADRDGDKAGEVVARASAYLSFAKGTTPTTCMEETRARIDADQCLAAKPVVLE